MTDPSLKLSPDIAAFYDTLAPEYDAMTGFEKRFAREHPHFRYIVERFDIRSAVDAGCGTGFHSILLAQLGVAVTAVDISSGMIDRLRMHAESLHLPIRPFHAPFARIPEVVGNMNDAVFCLGNSLPHLTDPGILAESLGAFRSALRPGGVAILHLLNYDRIMAEHATIQNMRDAGEKTFTRFYDYRESLIDFSIKVFDRSKETETVQTIPLRPLRASQLTSLLAEAGFGAVNVYGGMSLQPFDPASSRDVVMIAGTRLQ